MSEMLDIVVDSAKLRNILRRLARAGADLTPAMRQAAGIMADAVEENFEQEGRPKWRSLAPSTIRQREKEGKWPGKILQRSGNLARSITRHSDAMSAVVGSNLVYAAIHECGGKAGRKHRAFIPSRPYLMLDDDDMEDLETCFAKFLAKAVG